MVRNTTLLNHAFNHAFIGMSLVSLKGYCLKCEEYHEEDSTAERISKRVLEPVYSRKRKFMWESAIK